MKKNNFIALKAVVLVLVILLTDQIVKIYVKTHFALGEGVEVFSWFKVYFIENNGMAFGMEVIGKLFLTIFRIIAVGFLIYYIIRLIKNNARTGFILTVALVLAGAAGNIIDSVFYGVLFGESTPYSLAQFLPEGGGYAPLFHGKVVDMLYFPLFTFPDWMPLCGGSIFFSPIFNIADSAITVAIVLIILFFAKDLNTSLDVKKTAEEEV
ncbi:MAG: lipoprotein signal peptidase [Prevotellaceae bacterium]|jgi:signal peptidase II|nr:lipoprotein signal peptidase [Prevotellaceae bacterium]